MQHSFVEPRAFAERGQLELVRVVRDEHQSSLDRLAVDRDAERLPVFEQNRPRTDPRERLTPPAVSFAPLLCSIGFVGVVIPMPMLPVGKLTLVIALPAPRMTCSQNASVEFASFCTAPRSCVPKTENSQYFWFAAAPVLRRPTAGTAE